MFRGFSLFCFAFLHVFPLKPFKKVSPIAFFARFLILMPHSTWPDLRQTSGESSGSRWQKEYEEQKLSQELYWAVYKIVVNMFT